MRTYIFTEAEREAVRQWLEWGVRSERMREIRHHLRQAKQLVEDMKLLDRILKQMREEGMDLGVWKEAK